ncbi:retrovirus-related pol polyprotein from transposon TNT 1-94 [Tanacetum coccineum]
MSRTMLNEQSLPQKFWCNAVDTSTYILNRILIRAILGKTPYELLRGRKPTLDYFRVFGSKCFILNTKDYLTKFDPKSYEGVFLGYSQNSKAYIILNKHTRKVEESLNVTFDETPPPSKTSPLVDDDLDEEEEIKWSLDDLPYSVPSGGPYQTNPPSPDDIKLFVQIERWGVVTRIRHEQKVVIEDNQILTREITDIMKTWVDIIRENVFCLCENQDHIVTKQGRLILPYGMLLTRMFDHIMSENPELSNHLYVLYDRVMYPFASQQERKTRKDYGMRRGCTFTSSSSAFGQPSSSHLNDDDNDGNNEGTSHVSTPSPTRFVNSLTKEVPQVFSNLSYINPNMKPFYTRQTEVINYQVQLRDEQHGRIRSIRKSLKNLLRGKKKK